MCCLIPGLLCRVLGLACLVSGALVAVLVLLHHKGSVRATAESLERVAQRAVPLVGKEDDLESMHPRGTLAGEMGGTRCASSWHYLLATDDKRIVASFSIRQTKGYTFELDIYANRWVAVAVELAVSTDTSARNLYALVDDWNTGTGPLTVTVDNSLGSIAYHLPRQTSVRIPAQWNSRPVQASWTPCYGDQFVLAAKVRFCNPHNPQNCYLATLGQSVVAVDRWVAIRPCCVGACCTARHCLADWMMEDDCATQATFFVPDLVCKPSICASRP